MIKAVIFDFDNTLMDFMRMKKAAVETAVDAMIDAGLPYKKEHMIEKIYKVYTRRKALKTSRSSIKCWSKNWAKWITKSSPPASSDTAAPKKERSRFIRMFS